MLRKLAICVYVCICVHIYMCVYICAHVYYILALNFSFCFIYLSLEKKLGEQELLITVVNYLLLWLEVDPRCIKLREDKVVGWGTFSEREKFTFSSLLQETQRLYLLILYICAAPSSSHLPHVTIGHLKCD